MSEDTEFCLGGFLKVFAAVQHNSFMLRKREIYKLNDSAKLQNTRERILFSGAQPAKIKGAKV